MSGYQAVAADEEQGGASRDAAPAAVSLELRPARPDRTPPPTAALAPHREGRGRAARTSKRPDAREATPLLSRRSGTGDGEGEADTDATSEPGSPKRPVPVDAQSHAWFGYIALAGCVAGMLFSFYLNGWVVEPLNLNMMVGPGVQALIRSGAKDTPLIVERGEWWRLFTPMWLHAGLLHLASNMLILTRHGWPMEKEAGCLRFAPVYILGGLLGTIASALFIPHILSVGASGACFAIIGAVWGDMLQNGWVLCQRGHGCRCGLMLCCLTLTTALNLALGLLPFVDNFAHVFGFIGGLAIGSVTMIRPQPSGEFGTPWQLACAWIGGCGYVLLTILFLTLLYFQVKVSDWCPFCDYISCFPILDLWTCDQEIV